MDELISKFLMWLAPVFYAAGFRSTATKIWRVNTKIVSSASKRRILDRADKAQKV